MFLYFCFFLLSPDSLVFHTIPVDLPAEEGHRNIAFWANKIANVPELLLAGIAVSAGEEWPSQLGLKWVFCITCWILFRHITSDPFAKLIESWPFQIGLQEIDLCVHAMLGKGWMKSKSGGKMEIIWSLIVTVTLQHHMKWAQIPRCNPVGDESCRAVSLQKQTAQSENLVLICSILWWLKNAAICRAVFKLTSITLSCFTSFLITGKGSLCVHLFFFSLINTFCFTLEYGWLTML